MSNNCQNNICYCRLDGANGASYFFPVTDWKSWRRGLEFYRGFGIRGQYKKKLLTYGYLWFRRHAALSRQAVSAIIAEELTLADFLLPDEVCSILISPTRDKMIIHHHGRGYTKVAVGKSITGVTRELEVYHSLNRRQPKSFAYSAVGEELQTANLVRFFMKYAEGNFGDDAPPPEKLIKALSDFFSVNGIKQKPWQTLWRDLVTDGGPEVQKRIVAEDEEGFTAVGMVHRDFKPWNVKSGEHPLFFDFEMAKTEGCPLEDLLNYVMDPLLANQPATAVKNVWHSPGLITLAGQYLNHLGLTTTTVNRYRRWYLLERFTFWQQHGQPELADRYLKLYESK